MTNNTNVVVVGGGYAGTMAASRLTRREDVAVRLVNPRPTFVDRIRLHQRVGGTHDAVADYRDVLAPRAELVVDAVTRIDAAERSLTLAGGGTLGYDYLIYAVGSSSATPNVPGAAEHSYPIATLEDAQRLRQVLLAAPTTAAVTVVGSGPSGLETAAELAEEGRSVTLVCGNVLAPSLHPRGRRRVAARLAKLGVNVLEEATVTGVSSEAVRLADGRELPSAVTIWTAGFGVPDLASRSGLTTDAVGRLLTDETLASVDDTRIVGAGDAVAPSDLPYRMSCQAAVQLGPQAAETVLSRIAGERPADITVGFAGQCISLGRHAGIFQFARMDDTPTRFAITGRPGGTVKELICKGIMSQQVAYEARKPGARSMWGKDPRRSQRLQAGHGQPLTTQ